MPQTASDRYRICGRVRVNRFDCLATTEPTHLSLLFEKSRAELSARLFDLYLFVYAFVFVVKAVKRASVRVPR